MYQKIKSYEVACMAKGINPELLPDVSMLSKDLGEYLINVYKLTIICQAINGDWQPDYGNHDQLKWYPWFYVSEGQSPGSAGGFSFVDCYYVSTNAVVGARHTFETEEKAAYAGKTFLELYEKVFLIPSK